MLVSISIFKLKENEKSARPRMDKIKWEKNVVVFLIVREDGSIEKWGFIHEQL